ncbi:MAG: hypothetical protein WBG19_01605 [Thermoplasmata archaeon]
MTTQVDFGGSDPPFVPEPSAGSAPSMDKNWASEQDLSYNSLTRAGGGVEISWNIPISGPFVSGSVKIWNATQAFSYSLNSTTIEGTKGSGLIDLFPTLTSNHKYSFTVTAVYDKPFYCPPPGGCVKPSSITSSTKKFTYHFDQSKDGLTNAEKQTGWYVPLASGPDLVTPSPSSFSTNGLANDYLEDVYGLNPNTVDSAGSGMLDLWNLTFALGTNSTNPGVPEPRLNGVVDKSFFALSSEEGTRFDPFSGKPSPNDTTWPGTPIKTGTNDQGISDILCVRSHCLANSSYSAEVLWSRTALLKLLNTTGIAGPEGAASNGGSLRGILGTYGTQRTLTLWGKLSWGADPYVVSTPGDGIPDGASIDPAHELGLETYFERAPPQPPALGGYGILLNPNDTSGGCGNLPDGSGIAVRPSIPDAVVSGRVGLDNYTAQFTAGGSGCPVSGESYITTLPVNQELISEPVSLGLVANISTSRTPELESLAINGCRTEVNLTVNMLAPAPVSQSGTAYYSYWGNSNGQCSGSMGARTAIDLGIRLVSVGVKSPTYLWLPDGNQTLTQLPAGLQHFVGEQDFVEVEVNYNYPGCGFAFFASNECRGVASSDIPFPESPRGTYNVTFAAGVTNLLIPRVGFFASDFGQAIFKDGSIRYTGPNTLPILGSGGVTPPNFGGANGMRNLACYWQNRTIEPASGGALCSTELGVGSKSPAIVSVLTATQSVSGNTGGLTSGATVEPASAAGASVQAIVTLTLNLSGNNFKDADLLLASLLDNSTGGVNGSFENITGQTATLGFSSAVLSTLANNAEVSDGIWGVPVSRATPPQQSKGALESAWNTVSGIGTFVVKSESVIVGYIWSATKAGLDFLGEIGNATSGLGEEIAIRTVLGIEEFGGLLYSALKALYSYLISAVDLLFSPITIPIVNEEDAWGASLWKGFVPLWSEFNNSPNDISDSQAAALVSNIFGTLFGVALGLSVAVTVAFTIIQAFGLGSGFLVDALLVLLVEAAAGIAASFAMSNLPYFLSADMVRGVWAIGNTTVSAFHNDTDTQFWNTNMARLRAYAWIETDSIAGYQSGTAVSGSLDLVYALSRGVADLTLVTATPVVAAASGILSIILDLVGHKVGGSEGTTLEEWAFVIGGAAAAYSAFILLTYTSELAEAGQLTAAIFGSLLDVVSTGVSVASLI